MVRSVLFGLFVSFSLTGFSQVMAKDDSSLYVASYNIFTFGRNGEDQSWHAAQVIASGQFDLIAIQEVMEDPGVNSVNLMIRQLKDSFNLEYTSVISADIGVGYQANERIAFVYRPDKVKLRKYKGEYIQTIAVPDGRNFVLTRWKSNKVTFILGSGHLYYGKDGNAQEREETLRRRTAELNQVLHLFDNPKKELGDGDLIFVGDFNRAAVVPDYKSVSYDMSKYFVPNIEFFDPKLNEVPQVKTVHIEGKNVPGNDPQLVSSTVAQNTYVYDMIVCAHALLNNYQAPRNDGSFNRNFGVISYDKANGIGYQPESANYTAHNDLKKAYSDHRPVWVRLNTKIP